MWPEGDMAMAGLVFLGNLLGRGRVTDVGANEDENGLIKVESDK